MRVYRLPNRFDPSYRIECGDLTDPFDWCCSECFKPIPYDAHVCAECESAIARAVARELAIGVPEQK